jgi:hypothetical protein
MAAMARSEPPRWRATGAGPRGREAARRGWAGGCAGTPGEGEGNRGRPHGAMAGETEGGERREEGERLTARGSEGGGGFGRRRAERRGAGRAGEEREREGFGEGEGLTGGARRGRRRRFPTARALGAACAGGPVGPRGQLGRAGWAHSAEGRGRRPVGPPRPTGPHARGRGSWAERGGRGRREKKREKVFPF